jgi:hypothetical protein
MKTNKRNHKKFTPKNKRNKGKTIKNKRKIKKMYGGNTTTLEEILNQMPMEENFTDIKCGSFVPIDPQPTEKPAGCPPNAVYGTYTSSGGQPLKTDWFFYVKNFKYKYAEYQPNHKYTGYASLNPKAIQKPNDESARLQRYFQQIQGINTYPNGDICIGCFFNNTPDGQAKYYKYLGENTYELQYDGEWKNGRYHAEPLTLQKLAADVHLKKNKGKPLEESTKFVLETLNRKKQPDIPYHISDND